jgi:hypothetical protein
MKPFNRRQAFRAAGAFAIAAFLAPAAWAVTQANFRIAIRNFAAGAAVTPGVFVVAPTPNLLFASGAPADEALKRLVEEGELQPLLDKVSAIQGLAAAGTFLPGQLFLLGAFFGDRLQFVMKFAPSRDLFFAPRDGGIHLFDAGGRTAHGRVTRRVALFDSTTGGADNATPTGETMIDVEIEPTISALAPKRRH